MSRGSNEVCERIVQTDLHAVILEKLNWSSLSAATLKDPPTSSAEIYLVQCLVSILHNIVRRSAKSREVLRNCRAVNRLYEFCDKTKHQVNFLTCLFYQLSLRTLNIVFYLIRATLHK